MDADRIFQPFQRLNNLASHEGEGFDLGLITAVHGGFATARPRDEGGLSITVTIPMLTDLGQDGTDTASADGNASGAGLTSHF